MKLVFVERNRKGWVDALRGLAILLVIYGHSVKDFPEFFVYSSPIKMPLFFAISGYVFSVKKDWVAFFINVFWKLVIPWILLGLIPSVLMIPFKGVGNVWDYFLKMLSGEAIWFMPCFIIAEVFFYVICRYCKNTIWITFATFFCFFIGLFLHQKGLLNYAMFNRALVVQVYFLIGYLFRQYEQHLTSIRWYWIITASILYFVLCYFGYQLFPGSSIDVHQNRYYNIPYCLLVIFLGCLLCFTIACKANIRSTIMSFIGQNTLVLYIWHGVLIMVLVSGLRFLGWSMPINWWTALIKLIWACITCGISAFLLNNYLPFLVGKKRKKETNVSRQ